MRYIDADALVSKLDSLAKKYSDLGKAEVVKDYIWASAVVEASPTADVVEVVRCAQCKHKRIGRNSFGVYFYCGHPSNGLTNIGNVDKDFCSYGERRNDG